MSSIRKQVGDELDELFELLPESEDKFFKKLLSFTSLVLYHKFQILDSEVPSNIAEEVFMAMPKFSQKSKFSTWAWEVISNLGLQWLKQRTKERQTKSLESVGDIARPDPAIEDSEAKSALRTLCEELEDEEKSIVSLRLEGYSFEEIGEQLSQSPDTIYSKWKLIMTKLEKKARRK